MWFREPRPAPGKPWDERFELVVNFEINRAETGHWLRPYIALWIEDAQGASVRTLILWRQAGRGVRWLGTLKRWMRGEKLRRLADGGDLDAVLSGPTRQAGKYQATWDGRDDQKKLVTQGRYFLCLEAAREHGTYQLIRKEIVLGSQPIKQALDGNIEVKSAAIEYRRK